MLNDLRRIIEEDNRIERDLELMMEGTDADMADMFIDDDDEILESELTKILTKIPEYNRDEELNKRLKRLTESVIPDYDIIEEFFGFNKPKVDKDEQMFINSLTNVVIIDKDELSKYKREINKVVKSLYSLLKKEIPKCDFIGDSEDNDIVYSINKKYGYTVYFCGETIFELDSDNFDKYKAKSKIIKNVDYDDAYDYVDEIMNETEKRILKPLQRMGLEYDVDYGPFAYSKFKDGKRYFTVDLGDEYMFDVTFEARFAVKD